MTTFPSIVDFSDVKDSPRVRMTLPGPLTLGTRLIIRTLVRRKNGSRTEELRIDGDFKVVSSSFDVTGSSRQLVTVEAVRVAPSWKAVRNVSASRRKPPPARAPRTVVA
jgi:hypothetical protein